MKKIHYQNIGFPLSDVEWLWDSLLLHPEMDYLQHCLDLEKVPVKVVDHQRVGDKLNSDLTAYLKEFDSCNVSLNFDEWNFILREDDIQRASEYTTHTTMILRNPYEIISESAQLARLQSCREITSEDLGWIYKSIRRWASSNHKFKILWYDDMMDDHVTFYNQLCDFLGLRRSECEPFFHERGKFSYLGFSRLAIREINTQISKIEEMTNEDLSEWKR